MVDKTASRIALLERRADRERQRRQAAERAAERGLRRLYEVNQDLDQLVAERTAEALASFQVAEQALGSRVDILRMIAQEILTPLQQIQETLELVGSAPLQEMDQRRFAASAVTAQRCVQLVSNVVDLVAIESADVSEPVEPRHPLELLDEVISFWQTRAAQQGCTLLLEVESDRLLEVESDRLLEVESDRKADGLVDGVRVARILDELLAGALHEGSTRVLVKASIAMCEDDSAAEPSSEVAAENFLEIQDVLRSSELVVSVAQNGESQSASSFGADVGLLLATRLAEALGGTLLVAPAEPGASARVLRLPIRQAGEPISQAGSR
jgi:signal transduction histidine kinase